MKLLKPISLLIFTIFISFGCSNDSNNNNNTLPTPSANTLVDEVITLKILPLNFAVLGPISDATVKVYKLSDNSLLSTTKTYAYANETKINWLTNKVGSFKIIKDSMIDLDELVLVEISGGVDIDRNDDGIVDSPVALLGKMYAITSYSDLINDKVKVSVFSTLAIENTNLNQSNLLIKDDLNEFARKIFAKSINDDLVIDYKDLNSYIPLYSDNTSLINPNMYAYLQKSSVIDTILGGQNITDKVNEDVDNDTLSLMQEILLGTNPMNDDTDFDGLKDNIEVNLGYNPINSDSDGDFFPDSIDSDILNPDTDSNGILDGLDGDPLFYLQWYIKSEATIVANTNNIRTIIGNDLNILDVYHKVIGKNNSTIIQVVDSGVELSHEDLSVDINTSLNTITGTNNPTPTNITNTHGTSVAGIIAAKANNGVGMRGIFPNASIAGSNWLENQTLQKLDDTWLISPNNDNILVSNNSWGQPFLKDEAYEAILKIGSETLRAGKGRIYTFAAGNGRANKENANLSYLANNRYAITVAAINHENKYASYSVKGSNILVSAYGGEKYNEAPTIATTTISGASSYDSELGEVYGLITVDEDISKNYTFAMNGTSAATPMVSGSIGLVLQACPDLTYRDVKWLIAHNSKLVDISQEDWVENSAGLKHNINYGYGLIDTLKIINECRGLDFTLLTNEQVYTQNRDNINMNITDDAVAVSTYIDMPNSVVLEWVELTFDSDHSYIGDLEILLISPSGTQTQLIHPNHISTDSYNGGFRFSSAAFIGEDSAGRWVVKVIDHLPLSTGKINALNIKIYGH